MMLEKGVCAPNINTDNHYTCFTQSELEEIAKSFNNFIKVNDLCSKDTCLPKIPINISSNKRKLWKSIYNRLSAFCKYEYCWIDLNFINIIPDNDLQEKLKFFTFKPKTTKTNYSWLSNYDINHVMKQYEKYDRSFKFLGSFPSDFQELYDVDYNALLDYRMVSIVLNLDNHKQSGSHWVSLVIDNNENTIEYFDSVGDKPSGKIRNFVSKLRNEIFPGYYYKSNKVEHQKLNTECGVYSMYFILQRLLGYTFEEINKKRIKDKDMNKLRKYLFRPRK